MSSQILEYLTSVFLVDDEVLIVKVADFQLLSRGENRTFRASMKSVKERKWLWPLKVENWEFMLRVESGKLHLLRCSKRSCQTRGMLLGVGWPVLAFVQVIFPWKYWLSLSADAIGGIVSALSGLTSLERLILFLVLYALVASGLFIILFYFGTFGILCLLDILTIRLQARFAVDIALLNLKETRLGRFRHDIVVSTEKTDSDSRLPSGDFHLIVTARRGALASALVHRGAPL